MPRAPITYQTRPQKWTDETLNDALNSFQYGILTALTLLDPENGTLIFPGFEFVPDATTPEVIKANTVCHGQPYPDPIQKKWSRNRGRASVAASTFISRNLWPTPIITASAQRTGTEYSMSPKVALAMLNMSVPSDYLAVIEAGLTPHLDHIASTIGLKYEDHGIRTSNDRKLPSDATRELIRLGRANRDDLQPFAVRLLRLPLRSLLNPSPPAPGEHHKVRTPVPAKWLYETSLLTGVPVTTFVRYAGHDFNQRGTTYMNEDTRMDLIGLLYEGAPVSVAQDVENLEVKLPEGEYW